jgi:hypothetical protein
MLRRLIQPFFLAAAIGFATAANAQSTPVPPGRKPTQKIEPWPSGNYLRMVDPFKAEPRPSWSVRVPLSASRPIPHIPLRF